MTELICIICPNGCRLTVKGNGLKVEGAKCARGKEFARIEIENPRRVLCTTVKTVFSTHPYLSVRTSKEIPKDKLMQVMKEIKNFRLERKVGIGEAVIENLLGTGADLIATEEFIEKEVL
ncbi:MAG: DUF1667 domain-containing protein [Acholeplasmataceae bacterium]|nr:DUF1667 domain-containing protein [Acholeplasmataceae bacterium]